MRVGLGSWGETLREFTAAARAADTGGFDMVWATELHRTAFLPLAAVAAETERIGLGSAIALAFVRSPLTTALAALDLDELCDGRFILGLGTGVERLNEDWHNARFGNPSGRIRETVGIIRRVAAEAHTGNPIEWDGEWERIRLRGFQRPFAPVRECIPLYLGAIGPVMTRLAAEVADGWIGFELGSPAFLEEHTLPNIRRGLDRSGRSRDDVVLVASAACVVDNDSHRAKRMMAGLVAFYASVRTYTEFFAFHGFEREALAIQGLFRSGDIPGMIDACSDEMVDGLTLAGTADEVREKLGRYEGLVDSVKLTPPTHHTDPEVTRGAQQSILELFAT